jgi:hypothetical protein
MYIVIILNWLLSLLDAVVQFSMIDQAKIFIDNDENLKVKIGFNGFKSIVMLIYGLY